MEADYVAVAGMREVKDYRFGATDMYFVVVLRASTLEVTACEHEISDCKWWPIDEYLNDKAAISTTYGAVREVL